MPAEPTLTAPASTPVRRITVEAADGITLSGLLAEPPADAAAARPRATVVALHGGGMSAGYFDCPGSPELSLLALAARRGHTVLALDRPGYGDSARELPEGLGLTGQAAVLRGALTAFARQHAVDAGYFLAAHSYGGKLALATAAAHEDAHGYRLLGADISGLGHRWAVRPPEPGDGVRTHHLHWGPLRSYAPETFRHVARLTSPMPAREAAELPTWQDTFDALAPRVRIPLRLTFAEHERWWRHDEASLADMAARLGSRRVLLDRQPGAGHNISLGHAAGAYHLRLLSFLEDCLSGAAR
ncbi:alpha/beta fold hydrolase [Streptomyces sp. HNM0574]|uniref:alpha/beta hydrolase n=1 Tax=Streptomyces sp. HNM0574 TaxID=2714954 RepID=UPI00146CDB89|nr:alpha/beta fold hydrolase [Streptomyces sp. HNM0574]NLU68533.1 alpha/beta hydrolase [Streptomyces sp. HNM0574]